LKEEKHIVSKKHEIDIVSREKQASSGYDNKKRYPFNNTISFAIRFNKKELSEKYILF